MSMTTIRKNAFLKIQNILASSVGVISSTSESRIDDAYDNKYAISSSEEALTWLKENQKRAQVYMETENGYQILRISGRYAFEPAFMVYLGSVPAEGEMTP
ncbi:hypothetical protein [Citrobacter freundii]|uniref:hypothetical protein n=1 Tax=Citrobacter freundii TaxID=546 RepID=UPI001FFDFA1D|nr:hypothetical protein [Citrobacter freundii]